MHARKKLLHVTFMAMLPSISLLLPSNSLVLPSSLLALASFSSARITIVHELLVTSNLLASYTRWEKNACEQYFAESKLLASYSVTSILLAN